MAQADNLQASDITPDGVEEGYHYLETLVQNDLGLRVVAAIAILIATAVLVHVATSFIKRVMNREGSLIPANSLFLNIARVLIWAFGLSFMLSLCFGINVTGFVAALGVGGLALSLGMQDTISNIIGGVNVSVSGLVKPGDHIKLGSGLQGTVHDVTLRQTVIEDRVKNLIIVPNSAMNTSTVTKLQPTTHLVIPVVVRAEDDRLTVVAHHMEKAVHAAVSRVSKVKKAPALSFSEITDYGYRGSMVLDIADSDRVVAATDAAVRAMALYAHGKIEHSAQAASPVEASEQPTGFDVIA